MSVDRGQCAAPAALRVDDVAVADRRRPRRQPRARPDPGGSRTTSSTTSGSPNARQTAARMRWGLLKSVDDVVESVPRRIRRAATARPRTRPCARPRGIGSTSGTRGRPAPVDPPSAGSLLAGIPQPPGRRPRRAHRNIGEIVPAGDSPVPSWLAASGEGPERVVSSRGADVACRRAGVVECAREGGLWRPPKSSAQTHSQAQRRRLSMSKRELDSTARTLMAAHTLTRRTLLKATAATTIATIGPWYVREAFSQSGELNWFTWEDYAPKPLIEKFTKDTGIKVNVTIVLFERGAAQQAPCGARRRLRSRHAVGAVGGRSRRSRELPVVRREEARKHGQHDQDFPEQDRRARRPARRQALLRADRLGLRGACPSTRRP